MAGAATRHKKKHVPSSHHSHAAPAAAGALPEAGDQDRTAPHKPATRFAFSLPVALVISFLMLWGIPKVVPSSDAITHVTARLQSALVGAFYPATHRDDVTVLLIDDASLTELGQGWPVPYRTHARWLSVLGQVYKPRAIFLDITFTQARDDATLPALVQSLCRLRDRGVPVFLAALPGPDGKLALRPGLETPPGEAPCFQLVGVDYEADRIDRLVWSYPLWREAEGHEGGHAGSDAGAHAGSHAGEGAGKGAAPGGEAGHGAGQPARSAALAMAEDAGGLRLAREEEPMALVWGVRNGDLPRYAEWCRPSSGLAEVLPAPLRALWQGKEAYQPICPYSRALAMRQLKPSSEADERTLRERLDGRFVLIGTSMAGSNDLVASPVHGPIPGVFLHAMALDNLLTYGTRYKRALEWELLPPWRLALLGTAVVILAHWLLHRRYLLSAGHGGNDAPARRHAWLGRRWWRAARAWLARRRHALEAIARGHARWTPQHLLAEALLAAGRLADFLARQLGRIVFSTAVILLVILLAQGVLDIGTLPVVDLAAMALAAEWLGWTRKITDVALGEDPDEPPLPESHHSE